MKGNEFHHDENRKSTHYFQSYYEDELILKGLPRRTKQGITPKYAF